jgi:hypothetical protein
MYSESEQLEASHFLADSVSKQRKQKFAVYNLITDVVSDRNGDI